MDGLYEYTRTCKCIYTYIHTYIHAYIHIPMCVWIYIYIYICGALGLHFPLPWTLVPG